MFGMGSKSIVGLDVGSSSIKAVELKKKGGQIEVAHLGLEPLSSDIVVDSMIVDSGTVSSAISKLFLDNQIKTKAVATAVSGHSVIVKKISLPSMSDQELAETIEKEAAQHIPFDLADVSLDYQILSDEVGSPQMDVLLVAVKKDKILNYTNVLSMSGRTPAIVDIDALALQNCYEYNYQPAPGQVVALLNLGASVMNINIVKGTTPLFPRDVSVGGHQYTDSLQKELDLSFEDAESLKLGNKVGTVSEDAKQPILQQVTEIIVLEIQKTFDFFRASAAGEHIEKIYLAGGSSKVPGLVEALRQEFSMPVELLNPFQRVMPPTEGHGAELVENNPGQMAVAVGLALRSFESL
jgi:type IV pilus assembly protein PilM